jgi:hypothetical protein
LRSAAQRRTCRKQKGAIVAAPCSSRPAKHERKAACGGSRDFLRLLSLGMTEGSRVLLPDSRSERNISTSGGSRRARIWESRALTYTVGPATHPSVPSGNIIHRRKSKKQPCRLQTRRSSDISENRRMTIFGRSTEGQPK